MKTTRRSLWKLLAIPAGGLLGVTIGKAEEAKEPELEWVEQQPEPEVTKTCDADNAVIKFEDTEILMFSVEPPIRIKIGDKWYIPKVKS